MLRPTDQVIGGRPGVNVDHFMAAELRSLPYFPQPADVASPAAAILLAYGHSTLLSPDTVRMLCRSAAIDAKLPALGRQLLDFYGL